MGGGLAAIPLQGRPAEFKDPNEQLGQMVQLAELLRRSKQQQAMEPFQMEAMRAEAEQRRLAANELKRAQTERDSLSSALVTVGGDFYSPEFPKEAAKLGVSAGTLLALQKQIDDAVATHSKRDLESLNFDKAKDAEIADTLGAVKDPFGWSQAIDKLVKRGLLKADEAAEITRSGFDPDTAARIVALHRGSGGILDRAIKEQQLAASQAAAAASAASTEKTKLETGKLQAELDAIKGAKPEDYEGLIDRFIPTTDKTNADLNAGYKAQIRVALRGPDGIKKAEDVVKAAASHAGQLAVATDPRATANKILVATKMNESKALAGGLVPKEGDYEPGHKFTIDDVPFAVRPQVENALKYQSALPPQSRLNPVAQATRWWTMALDPNYSEELFSVRKAAVLRMNTGRDKDKLDAMSTVLGHVGRLEEAVDALQNGDIRVLNGIANELGVATGSVPQVVFRTIVHRVGPELTQAYVGSGGEASERKEAGGDFDLNGAPDQIKGSARITAKLLASKMGSVLFAFKRAAHFAPEDPRGADLIGQFFTPEAISVMDRMFPGWKTEVEPGGAIKTGGGGAARTYVQYGKSGTKVVGFTADGRLWDVNSGKELDATTGKEK